MIHNDIYYMKRALALAANGAGGVSPNPMVGAVIVGPDGRIIGEGWHRRYGGPHAEVNAINSVKEEDMPLIPAATVYVTLEPCSHYGKTPPCSRLLIDKKVKRVVVGTTDPFKEVSGRGIKMLRDAGIQVSVGTLEKECRELNRRFITAHTLRRPWILLKWAQTADGFMASCGENGEQAPLKISNPLSLVEMHSQRALTDAILVGTNTIIADNPSLTLRLWPGQQPRTVLFPSARIPENAAILSSDPIFLDPTLDLEMNMHALYSRHSITSLMVEGGCATLLGFIDAGLYDEVRIETSPSMLHTGVKAPVPPTDTFMAETRFIRENRVEILLPATRHII